MIKREKDHEIKTKYLTRFKQTLDNNKIAATATTASSTYFEFICKPNNFTNKDKQTFTITFFFNIGLYLLSG